LTCSSDFSICFSGVLEELLVSFDFEDFVELDHSYISTYPAPSESAIIASPHQTVVMRKKRSCPGCSGSISRGKDFWMFRETYISMSV
jgi:hypothetical protein